MAKNKDLPHRQPETYLGDGLYASFDGFGIELRAPREDGDHYVILEPDMFVKLLTFVGTVWDLDKVLPNAKQT